MDRYQHALGRTSPSDIKLSHEDLQQMVKPSRITIYDNLYAKPAQAGIGGNQRWSVQVLFSVRDIIHTGSYDFVECRWRTLPSDEKAREFLDREVQYWFHHPDTIEMFKRYRQQVLDGNCSDRISRIDEYNISEESK